MKIVLTFLFCLLPSFLLAQYNFEPSQENPFGKLNPNAPHQVGDFAPLIGSSNCESMSRKADGSWNDAVSMIWNWKYIMNGYAVQDETLKEDGIHSGSIRQFNADSSKWYVHYYTNSSAVQTLPSWEGSKRENDTISLYREQQAPNGMDGFYRLTFYDISAETFEWIGEWVSPDESITYPTWKISCTKMDSD
jgi:hypothetical protein